MLFGRVSPFFPLLRLRGVSILDGGTEPLALVFVHCWACVGLESAGCWAVGPVPISVRHLLDLSYSENGFPSQSFHGLSN